MKVDIYDIECLLNFFSYIGVNRDTGEVRQFYIWEDHNDLDELFLHLTSLNGQIGFNNVNYDGQLIEYIFEHIDQLSLLPAREVVKILYDFSQKLINLDRDANERPPYYKFSVRQLDLYKIWHFDNKNKSQNLKGVGFHLKFPTVADLPIPHDQPVEDIVTVQEILKYNLNDVRITEAFLKKSQAKIDLRKRLGRKYNLDLINAANAKIGSDIVLELYCRATGRSKREVKKLRTFRNVVYGSEVIFPYIKFRSIEFNDLLKHFKSLTVVETKNTNAKSVWYKGFRYDFGNGGVHGCIEPGIYEANDKVVIKDCDVSSLYPMIAVANDLYPEHLGIDFAKVYGEDIVKTRLEEKRKGKDGDKDIVEGFKEAANCVFGKSNSKWSFLYDTKYTLSTTLNGQLLILMLAERLCDTIPSLKMIQANTDGLTVMFDKTDEPLYYNVCRRWEKYTRLELEYKDYNKFIVRDVNNYTAQSTDGKIKQKGVFLVDKELYQDGSFRVIPMALENYYFRDIPIEETIKSTSDIYDFCGWFRASKGYELFARDIYTNKIRKLPKSNRYYVAKEGEFFFKRKEETNEVTFVDSCKGTLIKFFNDYEQRVTYGINYNFYIEECQKIIKSISKIKYVQQDIFG